ncbi:MAG: Phthiocerol/phenolphthiocerol synthesis polyketide synthase type PpsA [Nocardia sp.]|uniref:polyketide synthase Pks13 n=1 Tax=Nocardia sp. TaxID=1821 RepID=UPI0026120C96|nr:polyketide synthase Pks13 [Nocardia sp.]MCU1644679.1 Phthiocerol/phenolphthiocerol synthesis polyketide synthase type PpsA [Nocardia sp.]
MAENEGTSPTPMTDDAPTVSDGAAKPAPTGANMSVAELREWLRRWVADATGQAIEQITTDRPLEEFGLSSRDGLALGGDIEDLTGVVLNPTIVFQHPTIASLSERVINGEPELPAESADDSFYTAGFTPGEAHDIAIVGLSTRLPGAGDTPESTWEFLINRGDGIRDLPEGRWSEFTSDPRAAEAVANAMTKGGYLDQEVIKGFDAEFFATSPVEVERMDPQQRLTMELTWEALEHARIPANTLKGEQVGVYIGSSGNEFMLIAALGVGSTQSDDKTPLSAEAYGIMGSVSSIIANRTSYFFDFRGPSVAIDTACSSSLVAVHDAIRALRSGEADLALAGGVNALVAPMATLGFDANGGVAKDGHIKAFSSDADGMVRGEGGALVVLKRLADAERDGDKIYAVIKGSAVNNDGRSNGLLAPNPVAQADVLRRAYRDAGIAPSSVDYIEAHGTGTPIGDPIEADALGRVIGRGRDDDKPALLGSAKSNFGHLESGAGAASLAKIVMALQHNVIPPSINYAGPSPYIPWDTAHLKVVEQPTEFPRYSGIATIGVSGFGFGGTNAHVVIQEYVPTPATPAAVDASADLDDEDTDVLAEAERIVTESAPEVVAPEPEWVNREEPLPLILPVSAYLPSRRKRAAKDLADWLESEAGQATPLVDVARSLAKRNHGRSRGVVIAKTHEEAVAGLRAIAEGKPGTGVFTADSPSARGALWVMAGFGAQHRKMGKQLYNENSIFRKTVDQVDEYVMDEAGYSVREIILDDEQDWDIGTGQVGTFTIQLGLAAILRAHGAQPEGVVGHSQGEVAGAYISGGLNLEDAVRVICARSRLMAEGEAMITDDQVRNMALVEYSAEAIQEALVDYPDLEVAIYAAPTNTVIGGPPDQVYAIVARAEAEGKFARVLQTRGAGHTSQMDPLLGELAAELAGLEPTVLKHDLYSTVRKDGVFRAGHAPVHDVDYWVTNMRGAVYFTNAIAQAVNTGITTYLELAPNSVALMQVMGTTFAAGVHNAALIPTLKRKEDESAAVISALAQLYVQGHKVDLSSLLTDGDYAQVPRTAFLRKQYWPKVSLSADSGSSRAPGSHVALPDGRHVWEVQANIVTDLGALVNAAAAQVLSDVTLGASVAHGAVPAAGTLTTTLTPHPGGASVSVHAKEGNAFRALFDAVVTASAPTHSPQVAPLPESVVAQPVAAVAAAPAAVVVAEVTGDRWSPEGSQTIEQRLAIIVAESMGYAVEDLPMEIPLMELGLDSLMAMRIKNRVEYEFDIPQLQIQAVRDASLLEVGKVLRYAIENREQLAELAARQAAGEDISVDGDIVAAARAAMAAGADPLAALPGVTQNAVPTLADRLDVENTDVVADATEIVTEAEAAEADSATTEADFEDAPPPAETDKDNVPPRNAPERLAFATWALVTGKSAGGIFNPLPTLDDTTFDKLVARLSERAKAQLDPVELRACETIEQISDIVAQHQENGDDVEGFVRTLRAREAGSDALPVFVFHPSGGNTLVYEPLLKRLPAATPMYGFERVDGSIEERSRQYIPEIRKRQPEGPYVFYGWSLGAVFALTVAQIMRAEGADVRLVGLIDLAIPTEDEHNSPEERLERIKRFQAFAQKTYGFQGELDGEQLEELAAASDEEQLEIIIELVKFAGVKIPGGVLEHQRTSWIEGRALQQVTPSRYDGSVVLYLADRYHDGIIELEPRFGDRKPNGGWDEHIPNLEVVHIPGDHLQIIDEPRIGVIGADLSKKLSEIDTLAK